MIRATLLPLCAAIALVSCQRNDTQKTVDVTGWWRAVLGSPGGPLPFGLEIAGPSESPPAVLINADQRTPVSALEIDGRKVLIRIDASNSRIEAEATADGRRMSGTWRSGPPNSESTLPFSAVFGDRKRFSPVAEARAPIQTVAGRWKLDVSDGESSMVAVAELDEQRDGRVLGKVLTEGGDYDRLDGVFRGGRLRLSSFDGSRAVLFDARAEASGGLTGELWAGRDYHATWSARRTRKPVSELLPDRAVERE